MSEQYVIFSLSDIPETGLRCDNRIYSKAVLEKAFRKFSDEMIIPRHLQNVLEHPQSVACSIRSHDVSKKPIGFFDGADVSEFMSEVEMTGTLTIQVMKDRHMAPRMSGSTLISWNLCQVIDHE
jgi:transcriptional regulator of NAD metabolism